MSADILELACRAMLGATGAMLLVMLLRAPIRRLLGAGAAYSLWLLAPAAVLASFLPASRVVVAAPDAIANLVLIERGAPAGVEVPLAPGTTWSWAEMLAPMISGLWVLGCLVSLALVVVQYRRLLRSLRLVPFRGEQDVFRANTAGIGPAVIGVWCPRIVVPADFEQRFDAQERSLILAHERAHLGTFDAQINGLAALMLCLGWFNPVFHLARRLLRIDQELACDERVMRGHGRLRRAYAEAMLKTQASQPIALACAWPQLGESSIRARLSMLARPQLSAWRRALGLPVCASLVLATGAAAMAAQPPRVVAQQAPVAQEAPVKREPRWWDPALCTRWGITCTGVESAVGDRPDTDSRRHGMHLVLALQDDDSAAALRHLDAGADVDFYLPGDGTPLVIAAQKRDHAMARLLLQAGANVNRVAPGDGSPLIVAAARGDLAMAEMLVEHGADVNLYARGDETPLINAARNNRIEVARYLIEKGADVNLAVSDWAWTGRGRLRSPLGEAQRLHHEEMIRLLREHHAGT